jgi:hypothetical protein
MRLLALAGVLIALIFTAAPAISQIAQQDSSGISKGASPLEAYKKNPDSYIPQGDTPYILQYQNWTRTKPYNPYRWDSCPKSTCPCKGGGCEASCCLIRP